MQCLKTERMCSSSVQWLQNSDKQPSTFKTGHKCLLQKENTMTQKTTLVKLWSKTLVGWLFWTTLQSRCISCLWEEQWLECSIGSFSLNAFLMVAWECSAVSDYSFIQQTLIVPSGQTKPCQRAGQRPVQVERGGSFQLVLIINSENSGADNRSYPLFYMFHLFIVV